VRPQADMTYWAVWDGDSTHSQTTSASTRVHVRGQIHSPAQGGYTTRNGSRLSRYARSCSGASHTGCPRFLAYASPLHPGKTLSFTVQGIVNGSWRTLLTGSHAAGSRSRADGPGTRRRPSAPTRGGLERRAAVLLLGRGRAGALVGA